MSPSGCARLEEYLPFIQAANVRRDLLTWRDDNARPLWVCTHGAGFEGDLVIGLIKPKPSQRPILVRDTCLNANRIDSACVLVIAPLGTRRSSTHVNGTVPAEGVAVPCEDAAWLAGESGLIGLLVRDSTTANELDEHAVSFSILGRICTRTSEDGFATLNVADLAVSPSSSDLDVPVITVAATSAEAGKSTLCRTLIRALCRKALRVAAIKVTGTGGTTDCRGLDAGASIALDQVDGGLATTYVAADLFERHMPVSFLYAQDQGADVIVAELGGDIMFANNPVFLHSTMFQRAGASLMVICNDSLAAYGATLYLRDVAQIPEGVLALVASPFRNWMGMCARMHQLALPAMLDPNNATALAEHAFDVLARMRASRPRSEKGNAPTLDFGRPC